jgi:hypothetical protein
VTNLFGASYVGIISPFQNAIGMMAEGTEVIGAWVSLMAKVLRTSEMVEFGMTEGGLTVNLLFKIRHDS